MVSGSNSGGTKGASCSSTLRMVSRNGALPTNKIVADEGHALAKEIGYVHVYSPKYIKRRSQVLNSIKVVYRR